MLAMTGGSRREGRGQMAGWHAVEIGFSLMLAILFGNITGVRESKMFTIRENVLRVAFLDPLRARAVAS